MQAGLQHVLQLPGRQAARFTPRTLLAILFRRRRLMLTTFFAVFLPIVAAVALMPGEYISETKVLVQRLRFDPMISANSAPNDSSARESLGRIEEQDVDSEIDLMQSDDLLRQAAVQSGLSNRMGSLRKLLRLPAMPKDQQIAKAARVIRKNLDIEPPVRSNIVTLRYHSTNPQEAALVLQALTGLYLERHVQVHRPAGSTEFFSQEVEQNRVALQEAEARLNEFTRAQGVVSADAENNTLLQKTADFDATLQSTKSQIAFTQQRIHNLEAQLKTASPRITTLVRTTTVPVDTLKSTLYTLELKRSELLTKYQPDYRLVQDVDKQIADTKLAIAAAEAAPSAERTTDQDPVHTWLTSELAKARSELVALQASEAQTGRTVSDYHTRSVRLEELGKQQQDLLRNQKAAEETYLASLRKQSDARLSEALDRSRIMNVAIAEAATVPVLPVTSPLLRLTVGFILALLVAFGSGFISDYWDPSFRTPLEVEDALGIPVLAAIPLRKPLAAGVVAIEHTDLSA
ncbi:MAG: hypothetical protein ABSD96_02015 [Candidatus Korobacteraceae bacterium]